MSYISSIFDKDQKRFRELKEWVRNIKTSWWFTETMTWLYNNSRIASQMTVEEEKKKKDGWLEQIEIEGQWYWFGCRLRNSDGYVVDIEYQCIQSLEITDNILNWGHTAVLMYQSNENVWERKPDPNQEPPPLETEEKYIYRNDKRDTIHFHLEPIPKENEPPFPPVHTMDIEFVVVDRKNLPSQSVNQQFTVLGLEEKDIQQMFERSIEWSTATAKLNPYSNLDQNRMNDYQREMPTGMAIRDILNETERPWEAEFWDDGITREFYSSYGNASVGEIISYLLRHNLSSAEPHDMCLFWKDRVTQKWRLFPLSKFCERAGDAAYHPGEWQSGHGYFDTKEHPIDPKFFVPMAPQWIDEGDGERALTKKNLPQFTYSDANAREADNLNAPLILVGRDKRKVFYYDTTAISQNVEDFIKYNYTSKKFTEGLYMAIPYNKAQELLENKRLDWGTHTDPYGRRNDTLIHQMWNKIVHSGVALLTTGGSTIYRAGTFFGVQSKSFQETKFDYRQYGTWFIAESQFTLRSKSFSVQLTCVKPESFRWSGVENALP